LAFMTCFNAGTNSGNPLTRMYITREGYVGINTTSPAYTLDVNGTIKNNNDIFMDSSSRLTLFNNTGPLQIRSGGSNTLFLNQDNAGNASLCVGGGNVGIGTTSPASKLHANGDFSLSANSAAWSTSAGKGIYMRYSLASGQDSAYIQSIDRTTSTPYPLSLVTKTFTLETDFVARLHATSTGNIGIGTTSPGYTLDVNGTGRFTGILYGDNLIRSNYNATINGDISIRCSPRTNGAESSIGFWQNTSEGGAVWVVGHNPGGAGSNKFGIYSSTLGANVLVMNSSGYVGIGTASPNCPLYVYGFANANLTYAFFAYNGINAITGTATNNVSTYSIYASHRIAASEFNAFSDSRIKKDIVDVNDTSALSIIRQIEPKRYTYKDVIGKGTHQVWGFIAQQVRSVLDYSTELIKDFIPNIYELADVTDGNTLILPTKTTGELSVNGRVRLVVSEEKIIETKITSIVNSSTFTVEETLPSNKAFVYGMEVDDFHTLNKDAIFTVATAALQEVDRELQAEKTLTQQQATTIQNLETRIISLEARLTAAGL
jgi:hypothetical protein